MRWLGFSTTRGEYSAKLRYLASMTEVDPIEEWWHKKIWKIRCPSKCITFLWLVLKKRVLTWDRLQWRGKQGPGLCYLCKSEEQINFHLFHNCPFSVALWAEISSQLGLPPLWSKISLNECFWEFFNNPQLKKWRVLPPLMVWGIWISRSSSFFEGKGRPSFKIVQQVLGMIEYFIVPKVAAQPRVLLPMDIDQSYPWGFVDGASQEQGQSYGSGFILFLMKIILLQGKFVWVLELTILVSSMLASY